MKFIVRFFPEMSIKSRPVRTRMVKHLQNNLRKILRRVDASVQVNASWDHLQIQSSLDATDDNVNQFRHVLSRTPGIAYFNLVKQYPLLDFEDMLAKTRQHYESLIAGKTFSVRCKRAGKHEFSSLDVEKYIGGGLNQQCQSSGVNLTKPDIVVMIEIKNDKLYVVTERVEGLGGYPIGCQDTVATLISGGFDSSVAAYKVLKRGLRTHFIFFNLGGAAHEHGVKQVSKYLWNEFGSSHRCKFVSVPFEGVVEEILTKVDNSQMGVILKRMMLRAAEQVADRLFVDTLVTGEAVAQVSSQTLKNLNVIDEVTKKLVLRPLVVSDKQDIVDCARQIGTAGFAETMPEYCGVISKNPTTRAKLSKITREETFFDFSILEHAVALAQYSNIDKLSEQTKVRSDELTTFNLANLPNEVIVIDVRHPDETDERPLQINTHVVREVPFYSLKRQMLAMDVNQQYALYCEKGIMSKLHAMYLLEEGFSNIAVLSKQ